jgi:uncharacterized protein YndB with AHSA1/START domain
VRELKNRVLEAGSEMQIGKPAHEVFEAIVDPSKMSRYFIAKSTGRMEEGKHLTWKFPEFDAEFPIDVGRVEKDRFVSWSSRMPDGKTLTAEITLTPRGENATVVAVTERGMELDDAGLEWLKGNSAGWAYFLSCLKAYLEYGINLRKGAFDFRFEG